MDAYSFYSRVFQVKNEELLNKVSKETERKSLRKGATLIRQGETVNNIYFLEQGITRGYFLNMDGKEITDCFSFRSGESAMPTCRLELNIVSTMTIEVLEDSSFFCLPISSILRLQKEYFEIILFYNSMLIHALEEHQKIKQILNQYTALQRYLWFLKEYPGIINRVNNSHIASFLGMTPITLSRIRRALKEEGASIP